MLHLSFSFFSFYQLDRYPPTGRGNAMVSSEDKYSHKSARKHPKGCGHANNINTQNVKWHPNLDWKQELHKSSFREHSSQQSKPKTKPSPLTGWWLESLMWSIQAMEYYSIIKGNKTLTHATTQMNLEISMMDEKNEYFLICFLLFFAPPPRPIWVQVDVKSWHRMCSLIILHLISRSLTKPEAQSFV